MLSIASKPPPARSWLDVSIQAPHELYAILVHGFLPRIEALGYGRYARYGFFEHQIRNVKWAQENNKPLLAATLFWSLYAHFPEVKRAVHSVELEVYPWVSEATLSAVWNYVVGRMNEVNMSGFQDRNADAIINALHRAMIQGVGLRNGFCILMPEIDAKKAMKKGIDKAVSRQHVFITNPIRLRCKRIRDTLDDIAAIEARKDTDPANKRRAIAAAMKQLESSERWLQHVTFVPSSSSSSGRQ